MSLIVVSSEPSKTLALTKNDLAANAAVAYLRTGFSRGRYDGLRFEVVPFETRGIEAFQVVTHGELSGNEIVALKIAAEAFLEGFRQPYEAINRI